ncbi:putative membrane metalloprotease ARASP2, chloroplastic [Wolffia australiana]
MPLSLSSLTFRPSPAFLPAGRPRPSPPFLRRAARPRHGRTPNQTLTLTLTLTPSALPSLLDSFSSLSSVAEAAAVLAAIVVVHESGHFLAAVVRGIHVSKFAVGFGPAIAKFSSNNIEFSLRAFPLGGFVAFPDDDPSSDFPPDDPDLLRNRPLLDRVLVVSSGVIANLLFAYALVFVQIVTVGVPVQDPLPGVLVPDVRPGGAAARAGVIPGDLVLSVNRSPSAPSVSDLVETIKQNPSRDVVLRVDRPGRGTLDLAVVPDVAPDGTGRIGVQLSPNFKILKVRAGDFGEAVRLSGKEFTSLTLTVVEGLKQTVVNFSQSAEKVSGPVAIIAVGAEVARSNGEGLFQFAAIINLNLAVINMLPLPALDGGTLALLAVEAVRGGRKIPKEVEQQIMASGITVVLFLGMFLIVRDTLNLDFVKQLL